MTNIFPEILAPNFFHVDKLPDYGLKLFENELGREIRRYTEDTGYKTELKIQYNGLRSAEVKALTAFYLQAKGTFDKFTLPINFYRSPSSITNSLTALADTTEWRFMNPPMIQTVISDIYTVEIRLLSLKDSLNPDSSKIIGFVNSVNVDFILPTILIPQKQVTELIPIALEFIISLIDLNQSVTVNSIDLTLETSELTFTTSGSGSVDSRSIQSLSLSFVASQTGFGTLNSFEQMPSIIVSGTFTSLARYIHLVNTASGVASTTLPSDALDDTTIIYSDYAGTSTSSPTGFGLNAFTLNAPVGQTIQGQSSRVLNVENTSIQVIKKGNRWTIIGTELATGNPSGGSISLSDEGTQLTTTATSLNFTGAGVTATNSGGEVTVNVPGGGASAPTAVVIASLTHLLTNPSFESPAISANFFQDNTVIPGGWGTRNLGNGNGGSYNVPTPTPNLSQFLICQTPTAITLSPTPFTIPSNCRAIRFSFWHAPYLLGAYSMNLQTTINGITASNFNPPDAGGWVKHTTNWVAVEGGISVALTILISNLNADPNLATYIDHVEVEGQFPSDSGGSSLSTQVITSNTTASSNTRYLCNTSSSPLTLTLPASPTNGDVVGIADFNNSTLFTGFGSNPLTITANTGHNITGNTNVILDIGGQGVELVFHTNRWSIISDIGESLLRTLYRPIPLNGLEVWLDCSQEVFTNNSTGFTLTDYSGKGRSGITTGCTFVKGAGRKNYINLTRADNSKINISNAPDLPAGSTYFYAFRLTGSDNSFSTMLVRGSNNYGLHNLNTSIYWWDGSGGIIGTTVKINNSVISVPTWTGTVDIGRGNDNIISIENTNPFKIDNIGRDPINMRFYAYIAYNRTLNNDENNIVYTYLNNLYRNQ